MGTSIALACYRELGAELRKRRLAAGLTEAQLGGEVGWSASKISRIESGQIRLSEVDVIHYLAFCGIYGKHCAELRALVREATPKPGYWLRQHEVGLPDSTCTLIYHESTAIASTSYEPQFVPGLLQTEGYVRALATEQWPNSDIELAVRIRQERQRILHRPQPARFTYFLNERALQLTVGSLTIMHDQLLTLLLLDGLPHVSIRVVPAAASTQAMFSGSFRLLEYTDHQPLVYLDGPFCGLFLEDAEYVDAYRKLIPIIADVALNEHDSREYLASLASDYDREGAGLDVRDHVEEEHL